MSNIKINPAQAQAIVHLTALHGQTTLKPDEDELLAEKGYFSALTEAGYEWYFDDKGRLLGWNDPDNLPQR